MKIGILITARLKSTRFPLKLIKEINGRTIIERVIERCKLVEGVDGIVLCTSTNHQDLPLIEIAKRNNIYYFNGDEDDVLSRLFAASKLFGFDYFIATSGENILFSVEHYNNSIKQLKNNLPDFVYYNGLPIGCAPYLVRVKAIEVVCKVKKIINTEMWGRLLNRPEIFNVINLSVEEDFSWEDLRLTIDYPEDFELLKVIVEGFEESETDPIDLKKVISFLKKNKQVREINIERKQMDMPNEVINQIDAFYKENKQNILDLKTKIYHND